MDNASRPWSALMPGGAPAAVRRKATQPYGFKYFTALLGDTLTELCFRSS
jgi:hypothetical protein